MRSTTRGRQGRTLRSPITVVVLAIVVLALLAVTGLAVTPAGAAKKPRPGTPTALAPRGSITTPAPTFSWSRAARAVRYDVRVYEGSALLFKQSSVRTTWQSTTALPANVALTWQVRARGRTGAGRWSSPAAFTIVTPSSAKAITAFGFATPAASGVIDEAAHTIAVTVPAGTDVAALAPTIAITGTSVSPAGGAPRDFSAPVTYTVTAADGSTQAYTVTVTVQAPLSAQVRIQSFAFTPQTLTVTPGTTVVWTNNDGANHTVTAVDGPDVGATATGLFESGALARGESFSFTFTTPGTYYYECQIHSGTPSMHAQVIVQ